MEEKLIELVKKEPCLYDKTNRHYKNIYLRDQKFQDFAKDLKIPADKLKKRWRSLRDSFFREIKKTKMPSRSGSFSSKKQWRYLEQMMFLKDLPQENTEITGNFVFVEENIFGPYIDENEENLPHNSNNEADLECSSSTMDSNSIKTKHEDLISAINASFLELVETAKVAFGCPPIVQTKTSNELFFESICKQVENANITPSEYGQLQVEILQVINKYINKT